MAGANAGVARVVHVQTGHGARERADVEAWARAQRGQKTPRVEFAGSLSELRPGDMDRGHV